MQIEILTEDDRSSIVDVLTESFRDYPVFTYALRDVAGETYEAHLRLLIGFYADARLMRGWPVYGVYNGDRLAAVMLLSDPVFKPRPESLIQVYDEVHRVVGKTVMDRLDAFDASLSAYLPAERTYFVGMLGVRPQDQGNGYGRALLDHVAELSRLRPESAGVTLTTELEKNVSFYEHMGYRILGKAQLEDLSTWLFMKET